MCICAIIVRKFNEDNNMDKKLKIAIGNDHTAVDMKNAIKNYIEELGHEVVNVGTNVIESCDYPVPAFNVAKKVADKEVDLGVLICGTGLGVSLAANKVKGIRAVCVSESVSSRYSREHNNANIICFGARIVGLETAKDIVREFLNAKFLGDRHERRVNQIMEIEQTGSLNAK